MRDGVAVFGVDFTSVPSARKPMTCVRTRFDRNELRFEKLERWHSFSGFDSLLAAPGPWVAGIDFPFGQARRFVENVRWPASWSAYVRKVGAMDRGEFRRALEDYKKHRPAGDKHHKRLCDLLSRSQSPQTLYGTPVSLMFFEGAPRLLQAGVHLPYNADGDRSRIALEAYPGIAARSLAGGVAYKSDTPSKQTRDQSTARKQILARLCGSPGRTLYGFSIDAPVSLAEDPGGDDLDALICAVQAAWAWARDDDSFGAPPNLDKLEGWIADPQLRR